MKKLSFLSLTLIAMTEFASAADKENYNPLGYFPGVNLSVADFGSGTVLNKDFAYPSEAEFTYFESKGLKIVRIPFKWERVQPELLGEFDPENIGQLDRCVTSATGMGLVVLLDPHNYSSRKVKGKEALIGIDPELTNKEFNDFWVKLGNRYKDNPSVWFGLMNEPNKQKASMNAETMQSAVNAIREAGIKNRILVPGTSWTGAHSWIESGNGAAFENFKDPADNFAFEVHQYLDKDGSGTHAEAVPGIGAKSLVAFNDWAKQHHYKAFLGEIGWDGNPANTQAAAEGDAALNFMDKNKDVWIGYTYWAAGPWWGDYMYTLEPSKATDGTTIDRNQLQVITKHLE